MQPAKELYISYKSTLSRDAQIRLNHIEETDYGNYVMKNVICGWSVMYNVVGLVDRWLLADIPVCDPGTKPLYTIFSSDSDMDFSIDWLITGEVLPCTEILFHAKPVKYWYLAVIPDSSPNIHKYLSRLICYQGELLYPLLTLTGKQVISLREVRSCLDIVFVNAFLKCIYEE